MSGTGPRTHVRARSLPALPACLNCLLAVKPNLASARPPGQKKVLQKGSKEKGVEEDERRMGGGASPIALGRRIHVACICVICSEMAQLRRPTPERPEWSISGGSSSPSPGSSANLQHKGPAQMKNQGDEESGENSHSQSPSHPCPIISYGYPTDLPPGTLIPGHIHPTRAGG